MEYKFSMMDILPFLPFSPPQNRSVFYEPCPYCDGKGRNKDKHLNINLKKDVFRCVLCDWKGGIFDLYSYYTGTPRENVREELIRRVWGGDKLSIMAKPSMLKQRETEDPAESTVSGVENRHAVYHALLSMLSLAPDHRQNLLGRGLSEQAVFDREYRTTPAAGGAAIVKHILDTGHNPEGVPGFYKNRDGQWSLVSNQRGILVPVRDIHGHIQGLQIRRDDIDKRKYRWLSSADVDGTDGCGAESWVHLSGPVREQVILTEGAMKADVIHSLIGQTVVAVPGVNSLRYLKQTLIELMELGLKRLMSAFDMDFLKNPHVQNGYVELVRLLDSLGLSYGTYLWHPDYKGLDDYIFEFCLERTRDV